MTTTRITGYSAIEFAARNGLTLSKHTDPTEDAREGLSVEEAREIAAQDPGLIYLTAALAEHCLDCGATDDLRRQPHRGCLLCGQCFAIDMEPA